MRWEDDDAHFTCFKPFPFVAFWFRSLHGKGSWLMLGQGLWCHWHTWILGTVSTPLSLPRPWLPLFLFSLVSLSSQSFPKLKQWKRICKLERITDTRYIFNAFQKHTRFCCLRLWFCTFSFCPHDPCTLAIKSSRLLFQKISGPKKAEPS